MTRTFVSALLVVASACGAPLATWSNAELKVERRGDSNDIQVVLRLADQPCIPLGDDVTAMINGQILRPAYDGHGAKLRCPEAVFEESLEVDGDGDTDLVLKISDDTHSITFVVPEYLAHRTLEMPTLPAEPFRFYEPAEGIPRVIATWGRPEATTIDVEARHACDDAVCDSTLATAPCKEPEPAPSDDTRPASSFDSLVRPTVFGTGGVASTCRFVSVPFRGQSVVTLRSTERYTAGCRGVGSCVATVTMERHQLVEFGAP